MNTLKIFKSFSSFIYFPHFLYFLNIRIKYPVLQLIAKNLYLDRQINYWKSNWIQKSLYSNHNDSRVKYLTILTKDSQQPILKTIITNKLI